MLAVVPIYRASLRPSGAGFIHEGFDLPPGLDAYATGPHGTEEEAVAALAELESAIYEGPDGRLWWNHTHPAYLRAWRV